MMTRILRRSVLFLLLFGFGLDGSSKPLDSSAAERLLELEKLSSAVNRSQPLSAEQWAVIETSLESGDDVSVAVATLFLHQIESERSRALLIELSTSNNPRGLLADAVFRCGQMKNYLEKSGPVERAAQWQTMANDANPYCRIAAAKALCAIDPQAAKAVLLRLEREKSEISPITNRIRRELAANMGEEPPPPIPGFETAYIWFERGAGSLAAVRFAAAMNNRVDDTNQEMSSATNPSQLAPTTKKALSTSPTAATVETAASSGFSTVPVAIVVVLIAGIVIYVLRRRST